jgi:hypothetical protein
MRSPTKTDHRVHGTGALPLSALLSQVLVAFTVEFDNEFGRQMPHRTAKGGLSDPEVHDAPWLTSLVMWANVMQFVGEAGITAWELLRRSRITKENLRTSLSGLNRWGYVTVKSAMSTGGPKTPKDQWVIRSTNGGREAQKIWRQLVEEIEQRWDARFGKANIEKLRTALEELIERFDVDLPEFFPVLKYGLFAEARPCSKNNSSARGPAAGRSSTADERAAPGRPLFALLSKVLLAFTMEFESESDVSLAISANISRLLEKVEYLWAICPAFPAFRKRP